MNAPLWFAGWLRLDNVRLLAIADKLTPLASLQDDDRLRWYWLYDGRELYDEDGSGGFTVAEAIAVVMRNNFDSHPLEPMLGQAVHS